MPRQDTAGDPLAALREHYHGLRMPETMRERVAEQVEQRTSPRRRRRAGWLALAIALGAGTAVAATVATRQYLIGERQALQALQTADAQALAKRRAHRSGTTRPVVTPEPAEQPQPPPAETTSEAPAPRTKRTPVKRRQPAAAPAPPSTKAPATPSTPATPSALAREVKAYRGALALARRDDRRALGSWRAMQRHFPAGALRHEVDLRVVETLLRLGRRAEAAKEARALLRRFPGSSRAAELRQLSSPAEKKK